MKILAIAAFIAATVASGAANAAVIHLTLDGVQPKGGKVLVAVQARDQFMQRAYTGGAALDGSASGRLTTDITVPDGDYAISVLHDANGDGQMAMDASGRPAEGWSTVNAASLRAAPTFEQVKVHVAGDMAVNETMIYPR